MEKETTTYTTLNNAKAEPLTIESIDALFESIRNTKPFHNYSQIQCGNVEKLCEKIGAERIKGKYPIASIWGFPVLQRKDLSENEARLVSSDGLYQTFTF